jgi:hypothetical protein
VRRMSPLARQVDGFRASHCDRRPHRSSRRCQPAAPQCPAPGAGRWRVAHGARRRAPPPRHKQVTTLTHGRIPGGRNGQLHRVPAAGAGGGRVEGRGRRQETDRPHLQRHNFIWTHTPRQKQSPCKHRVGLTGSSGPIGPTWFLLSPNGGMSVAGAVPGRWIRTRIHIDQRL